MGRLLDAWGRLKAVMCVLALGTCLALGVPSADAAQANKKNSSAQTKKKEKAKAGAAPRKEAKARAGQRDKVAVAKKGSVANARQAKGKSPAVAARQSKRVVAQSRSKPGKAVVQAAEPRVASLARASLGQQMGLRHRDDPLELSASVALVMDQDTNEILFSKNEAAVLPIASITKLMTGLVLADAGLSPHESITITQEDVDTYKGSSSRLAVGTTLSREELMHLALMSSENRAAHALGRTFPGGLSAFVRLMNQKASSLGMSDTQFVEPTGLSSANRSSARDLAILTAAAYERPILRQLSTSPSHQLDVGRRVLRFNNSNRLVHNPEWEIGLQKTGYISEAGRCLVMQARIAGRKMIMVLLDSTGKTSRADDAERMRKWIEATTLMQWPERPRS